ncbi:unnamed protein product [Rhizophagus irregularis]|uniref:Uncharacterized protein n=1 Tax=Rhizophagus irregularis TaxID=588596 RepID=A0A2N1NJ07_9GLOM|nr:hypothetical protein RhiirC2_775547 [Rhizophagus irregularis]CAB4401981.1 unnamed protein product [Rhizophagus irregularis]CAB5348185.1 unnamed protein product [Rhizophagus irregularis]
MKFELIRGECNEFCLEQQKNDGKTGSIYKKIERKEDEIFRITTDHMKIRVIETGHKWKGSNRTKYLKDSLKLNKMLKDMIMNLIFENNCNIFKQFQVIGILNGGNQLQMIIMDTPKGYIFYVRYKKFYEVSGHLLKIQPLDFIIKKILCAKAIIVKILDLINNYRLNNWMLCSRKR